jgi:hypothetical protein
MAKNVPTAKAKTGWFYYPKDGDTIPCPPDSAKTPSFFARGHFDSKTRLDPSNILVTYTDKVDNKQKTIAGTIVVQPHEWTVLFSGAGLVAANNPFTLTICNLDSECITEKFNVADPKVAEKLSIMLTHINAPTANQTVTPTFSATGNTDSQNQVCGNLIDNSSNVFPGTTVYDQNNLWVVQFNNIPAGIYTLTIVALPDTSSVSPIIVAPDPNSQGLNTGSFAAIR